MAKVDAAADDGPLSPNHGNSTNNNIGMSGPGPVEARSLSSVTAIASNPPAYPRNPTQKKLDALELYIVRVPGSRDVFLSPLKPPTKDSVSAEAINASLYYLHVATPEDNALLQEVEEEREEEAKLRREAMEEELEPGTTQYELARLSNVRRKPVPGVPFSSIAAADTDTTSSAVQIQENIPPSLPPRPEQRAQASSPLPGSSPTTEFPKGDEKTAPGQRVQFLERRPTRSPISRRPLPSVPKEEPSDGLAARNANRWSAFAGYANDRAPESWREKHEALSNNRFSLDSRNSHLASQFMHESSPPLGGRSPGRSPSRGSHDSRSPEPTPGFHITLIRRDPTHGSQWNVATISTPRLDVGVIDIEISTPGYNRFIAQDEPVSLANLSLPTDGASAPSLAALQALQKSAGQMSNNNIDSSTTNSKSHEMPGPRRFRRKLCVSKPHQDDGRGSMDQPGAARGSIDSMGPGSPTFKGQQGMSKLKSGYYTFSSPWNGTCTFATAVNGRSLKCKHMIPMHGPPGSNMEATNPAVTVAEIRFNTPFQPNHLYHQPNPSHLSPFLLSQTPTFTTNANANASHNPDFDPPLPSTTSRTTAPTAPSSTATATTSKRNSLALLLNPNTYNRARSHSGNSTLTRKPSTHSTTSASDDPDRLDFSLARERAGGGMRGKSAKLGKLVVEDEGIKMLDLVVAACMGVWWRGYYY